MRWIFLLPIPLLAQTYTNLRLDPADVHFSRPGVTQKIIATATDASGIDQDVTRLVQYTLPPSLALEGFRLTAKSPGKGTIHARLGSLRGAIQVTTSNAAGDMEVSFNPDILTILTIKGCNGSNCHGAIAGKSGFKLSLFGYDAAADHAMITTAHDGRRLSRTDPEKSLLLQKPSFQIAHGGGNVLPKDSADYKTLLTWLQQGAKLNSSGPKVSRIEIYPRERVLGVNQAGQRTVVMAHLTDGTTRDMTHDVRYESANDAIVKLTSAGEFQTAALGLTTILARGMGKSATAQIAVIAPSSSAPPAIPAANNFIDELVFAKLRRLNLTPAALSTDEQFLRRITIDTLGRVPKVEERRAFLAHRDRNRLIDELLASPEYVLYRTLRFEEWYRNTQLFSQGRPMGSFRYWLKDQVEADRPYDEIVRDLITSQGDTARNPAAGFWLPVTDFMLNKFDVKAATPTVTRLFLGLRMECAECHNHPLENFTQDDFYGLAAFFARMKIKIGQGVYRRTWFLEDEGEVEHPVSKRSVAPKFLGEAVPAIAADEDRREYLARWITSPANPYFARATVNRVWHAYFGAGIVEPYDDFRSTNMPTNRELLDRLAKAFIDGRFRMKQLDRIIFQSRTYQLASTPPTPAQPEQFSRLLFAHFQPRKLPAEVMLDSISTVTGIAHKFSDHPDGTMARDVEIGDQPNYFMATFGFPRRDTLMDRNESPNLAQALHMMNRATLKDKLESKDNTLSQMLGQSQSNEQILNSFYERAYSRLPLPGELSLLLNHIDKEQSAGRSRRRALENILLVMLNSKEFQLVH